MRNLNKFINIIITITIILIILTVTVFLDRPEAEDSKKSDYKRTVIKVLDNQSKIDTKKLKAYDETKPVRIAVLDTGLNKNVPFNSCDGLPDTIDFTKTDTKDNYMHGTNISYIIANKLKDTNYCITMFKIFNKKDDTPDELNVRIVSALLMVGSLKFDIVNLSWGGPSPDKIEEAAIHVLIDDKIKIFAAAGNDGQKLEKSKCNYYPACYDDRIVTVGNIGNKDSNYGPYVKQWENGNNINAGGVVFSGTSQATAIATSKYVLKLLKDDSK